MNSVNKYSTSDVPCYIPNPGFIMREIAGEILLVPVGEQTKVFNGMITFSETGGFIWNHLDGKRTAAEIAQLLADECGVSLDTVLTDVEEFLESAFQKGLVIKQ